MVSNRQITSVRELSESFLNEWKALWDSSGEAHVFNSPQWFQACQVSTDKVSTEVVICRENETLVAVLPLIRSRLFGIPVLRSPGGEHQEKLFLLMASFDREILRNMVTYLTKKHNIYLTELDERAHLCFESQKFPGFSRLSAVAVQVALKPDMTYLSKQARYRVKRVHRRYEGLIDIRFVDVITPEDMQIMFDIEGESYKHREGRCLFCDKYARSLYSSLAAVRPSIACIAFLYFQGKAVASVFNSHHAGILHGMHMAYHTDYRKLLPGKLLINYTITELSKRGFTMYDFGRGDNPIKRQFSDHVVRQYDWYFVKNPIVRFYLRIILWLRYSVWENLDDRTKVIPRRIIRLLQGSGLFSSTN